MNHENCCGKGFSSVELSCDGKSIEMNEFIQDLVGRTVMGLLSALKGVDHPGEIQIKIKK